MNHPRLSAWWMDDPADPDRPTLTPQDVQQLFTDLAPGTQAGDLGGGMSRNVRVSGS